MALRFMRYEDASVLRKQAVPVKEITAGTLRLLDDMLETMRYHHGVGLAAPQVGISKKIVVIEWGEQVYQLINPEIIESEGEIITEEGCLSFPGVWGEVKRCSKVIVKALNREGEELILHGEDRLAVIFQHELDHLKGEVFVDKVIRFTDPDEFDPEEADLEEINPDGIDSEKVNLTEAKIGKIEAKQEKSKKEEPKEVDAEEKATPGEID